MTYSEDTESIAEKWQENKTKKQDTTTRQNQRHDNKTRKEQKSMEKQGSGGQIKSAAEQTTALLKYIRENESSAKVPDQGGGSRDRDADDPL